jgi:hypothetical protein
MGASVCEPAPKEGYKSAACQAGSVPPLVIASLARATDRVGMVLRLLKLFPADVKHKLAYQYLTARRPV